tara:strand:- start:407 stop:748 length:342 start_codon:yes stop_codon:yes gene_type:complete
MKIFCSFILLFITLTDFSSAIVTEISHTESIDCHQELLLQCEASDFHDTEHQHDDNHNHSHNCCHAGHVHLAVFTESNIYTKARFEAAKKSIFTFIQNKTSDFQKSIIRPPIA